MADWLLTDCYCPVCRSKHDGPINVDHPPPAHLRDREGEILIYMVWCFDCTAKYATPAMREKYQRCYDRIKASARKAPKKPRVKR